MARRRLDPRQLVGRVVVDLARGKSVDARDRELAQELQLQLNEEMREQERLAKRQERREAPNARAVVVKGGQKASNSKLIRNAIEYNLMAGQHLLEEKQAIVEALEASKGENFIVLFRSDKSLRFYGLYRFDPVEVKVERIYGKGPPELKDAMVQQFYRYNSGRKEFSAVATRSFTVRTDAVALTKQHMPKLKQPSLY